MTRFSSWRRAQLLADAHPAGGRLARTLHVELTDSAVPTDSASGDISFVFRSAADIAQITERAIRHRAPAPGVDNEETTKCTHIDFHSPDLPWRYTPKPTTKDQLRPWLALLVGTSDEVNISGNFVTLAESVLRDYDLRTSSQWAHVQSPDTEDPTELGQPATNRFSRLLSLRPLQALTSYVAVVVRTFDAVGDDLWTNGVLKHGGHPVPALTSWTFTTGEGGDFETLAAQLHIPKAGDLGKAHLTFRGADAPVDPLEVRGALQSLQDVQQPENPDQADLARKVAAAVLGSAEPDELGPPVYGRPWVADPRTGTGWVQQLRADARLRIHAGTGQWTGVEAQDELMAAAIDQTGSLADAAGLIARTAAGLSISASLWKRALPADPVARLQVLAPMTTRLPVEGTSQMVAHAVTTSDRNLDRALLTGAGQRLLNRSVRLDRTPVASAADLLKAANAPAPADLDPWAEQVWTDLLPPTGASLYQELWFALSELRKVALAAHGRYLREIAPLAGRSDPMDIAEHVRGFVEAERTGLEEGSQRLHVLGDRCEAVWKTAAASAGAGSWNEVLDRLVTTDYAADLIYGPVQTAVLRCLIPGCEVDAATPLHPESECARLVALLRIPTPHDAMPISLDGLGNGVAAALDPASDSPPAQRSLDEQLPPILRGRLAPARYPLGLDFPTWTLLRRYEPDWLLPGAATVPKHSIIALRTNPVFIDAFLLGLNSQFLSEVRWRGLQVDRWGTPLRMFFAPIDEGTGTRMPDVIPIEDWPEGSQLGAASHQRSAGQGPTERLVLLFTTPLFRRYPRTLVYLQKRLDDDELNDLLLTEKPQLTPPIGMSHHQWRETRIHIPPVFSGTIGPDQVFFLFDVTPEALDAYFLVLDQPPSEQQRFRIPKKPLHHDGAAELEPAATVAKELLDRHTRVALDGKTLEAMGKNP